MRPPAPPSGSKATTTPAPTKKQILSQIEDILRDLDECDGIEGDVDPLLEELSAAALKSADSGQHMLHLKNARLSMRMSSGSIPDMDRIPPLDPLPVASKRR